MKTERFKKPEFIISAAGLVALAAVFVIWYIGAEPSAPGAISALLSAALFAALCLRFVPEWTAFWRKAPERIAAAPERARRPRTEAMIFVSLLAVNAAVVFIVYLLRRAEGYDESFLQSLEFWTCTDSGHYLDIARDWYLSEGDWDRLVQLVFLPGYPIAIRLMNLLIGNYLISAMLVSSLSFALSGCVIYRLLRLDFSDETALRAVKYLCLLPGSFFFASPMSESLFLLLCALCIYCARTKKWLLGCVFGALAAFTRSLGVTLFVPLFFEAVSGYANGGEGRGKRLAARLAGLLIIPAGFVAYCVINYLVSGDPFKFMYYQRVHWGQQLGFFFNTASYQLDRAISTFADSPHDFLGLWLPNLLACFLSLGVMTAAARKLRPSYTAWFIAYYVIAIGATWLLSAPRYLIAFFPLSLAVALLTEKKQADATVSALSAALYLLYLYAFVMRWQVW